MKSNTLKRVSAILAIVMGIIACRGQAVSQPTPSPSSEPLHEIYAGFTENEKIPFLMIHQSGESLGVIRDVNSPNNIGGIVWYSSEGQSVTVYTDNSQMPQRAVVGEDIILYSNYLNDTVDVTIIHPDGTSETFRAQIDTELLNKITAFSPSVRLVSYSLSEAQQLDKWFFIKTGLYIAGAALCIKDIPSAVGVPVVGIPLLLTGACSGFLLGSVIRAGSLLNIDVTDLADAKSVWDTQKCFAPASPDLVSRALACANMLAGQLEKQEESARQKSIVIVTPSQIVSNPCHSQEGCLCGIVKLESGSYNGGECTFASLVYYDVDGSLQKANFHPLGVYVRSQNKFVFPEDFAGKNVLLRNPNSNFLEYGIDEIDDYEIVDSCH